MKTQDIEFAENLRDMLMCDLSFDAIFEREGDVLRMDYGDTSVWFYSAENHISNIETLPKDIAKEVKKLYNRYRKSLQ